MCSRQEMSKLQKTLPPHRTLAALGRATNKRRGRIEKKWQFILLLQLTLLFTLPLSEISEVLALSTGTTYYVSPAGDDHDPGNRSAPWASPGHASRKLKPGDTLLIMSGRYALSRFDEDILTPPSGEAGAVVTIRGEEGHRPVLVGRNNLLFAINLSGTNYVHIENLEITHDERASGKAVYFRDAIGILEKPAAHIVLKDLYIHHVDEFGINIQDIEDLKVINCRIEYAGFGSIGGPQGKKGGWRDVIIQGSRLSYSGHYYQGGDGSNRPYDRPDGLGLEYAEGPIEIVDTVAEHNLGDGLDSKAEKTVIRRVTVANNSCDGIKLWGDGSRIENSLIYGRGDGNAERTPWSPIVIDTEKKNAQFEITNVTVDDIAGGNYLMYVQYDNPELPISLKIQNTIFRGMGPSSPIFIGKATILTMKHNLFYLPHNDSVIIHGDKEYTAETISSLDRGNFYAAPLFVEPAWGKDGNYHLNKGSPAIDRGSTENTPLVDLEGNYRDKKPDLGAYEFSHK